jgi:hypothetical protein
VVIVATKNTAIIESAIIGLMMCVKWVIIAKDFSNPLKSFAQ